MIAQKTDELYKRINPPNQVQPKSFGGVLIYMVLSLLILVSLYSNVGTFSRNIIKTEFTQMQNIYTHTYNYNKYKSDGETLTDLYLDYYNSYVEAYNNSYDATTMADYDTSDKYATKMADNEIMSIAQNAVLKGVTLVGAGEGGEDITYIGYKDMKEGWLWVKNIWRPDSTSSVFPSANEFITSSGIAFNLIKKYQLADELDTDYIEEIEDGQVVKYKKGGDGQKVVEYTYYYVDMEGNIYYSA